ncbi:hypothetical protein V6Z11_D05G166400 [Gossypium hirsutum]
MAQHPAATSRAESAIGGIHSTLRVRILTLKSSFISLGEIQQTTSLIKSEPPKALTQCKDRNLRRKPSHTLLLKIESFPIGYNIQMVVPQTSSNLFLVRPQNSKSNH